MNQGQVPLFTKYIRRHYNNKEVVINLSSRNGNSLVWTERNSGAEQLHSCAARTHSDKMHTSQNHSIKKMHFTETLHIETTVAQQAVTAQIPRKFRGHKIHSDPVGYHYSNGACLHASREQRKLAVDGSHGGRQWAGSNGREHSDPSVLT